jgi:hypothetical protein
MVAPVLSDARLPSAFYGIEEDVLLYDAYSVYGRRLNEHCYPLLGKERSITKVVATTSQAFRNQSEAVPDVSFVHSRRP